MLCYWLTDLTLCASYDNGAWAGLKGIVSQEMRRLPLNEVPSWPGLQQLVTTYFPWQWASLLKNCHRRALVIIKEKRWNKKYLNKHWPTLTCAHTPMMWLWKANICVSVPSTTTRPLFTCKTPGLMCSLGCPVITTHPSLTLPQQITCFSHHIAQEVLVSQRSRTRATH